MDATRDSHTKWRQSEREKQIPYDITYVENLKHGTNEPIYRTETDSQTWRADLWLPRGRGRGIDMEFGVGKCELLNLEWINNDVLLYSTGNYIPSLGIEHNGRQYEKKNIYIYLPLCSIARDRIYIYIWLGHFAVQQKLAQHCKSNIL